MSSLAPHLQRFFTERLIGQRRVSPHTVAAYRDAFRLLLVFIQQKIHKAPSMVDLADVNADLVVAFLAHIEKDRKNGVRTRNARLAAIQSFFHYVAFEEPGQSALIQRVLAIPSKRAERKLLTFLDTNEIDALLAAPDPKTALGRRDHCLLLLAIQTGLRVSELTQLRWENISLESGPHVRCRGKGRKDRCTPLTSETVAVFRAWNRLLRPLSSDPLFSSRLHGHMSRDAVEHLISKYATAASISCPALKKKRISPHTLRHTSAMRLLAAGAERTVIALWLGHESIETTEIYIHADMSLKERAMQRTASLPGNRRRYRPPDRLLAFLESL